MGKFLVGIVVALVIAGIAFFIWSSVNNARQEQLNDRIAAMSKQLSQLSDENTQLKAQLAKVQSEEQNLAAQNDELRKAIGSVKATGKLPPNIELELSPPK